MPTLFTIEFANEQNKEHLFYKTFFFLKNDFDAKTLLDSARLTSPFDEEFNEEHILTWIEQQENFDVSGRPKHHFWYNVNDIANAFQYLNAMVVLDEQNSVIAFLTWDLTSTLVAEITIIEVQDVHQHQGVGSAMLNAFVNKFNHLYALTTDLLPNTSGFFQKTGWAIIENQHQAFKMIQSGVIPDTELPEGWVIAICLEDFYTVINAPQQYQAAMKYFQITFDQSGELSQPIITPFKHESYMAIYFNRRLIENGKAKHLFQNGDQIDNGDPILAMKTFSPINPSILDLAELKIANKVTRKRLRESTPSYDALPICPAMSIQQDHSNTLIISDLANKTVDEIIQKFRSIPTNIKYLDLSSNNFGQRTSEELMQIFANFPKTIKILNLTDNHLAIQTGAGLRQSFAAIHEGIIELYLTDNGFGHLKSEELAQDLAAIPANVMKLDLQVNLLGLQTPFQLAQALTGIRRSITTVNLENNDCHVNPGTDKLLTSLQSIPRSLWREFLRYYINDLLNVLSVHDISSAAHPQNSNNPVDAYFAHNGNIGTNIFTHDHHLHGIDALYTLANLYNTHTWPTPAPLFSNRESSALYITNVDRDKNLLSNYMSNGWRWIKPDFLSQGSSCENRVSVIHPVVEQAKKIPEIAISDWIILEGKTMRWCSNANLSQQDRSLVNYLNQFLVIHRHQKSSDASFIEDRALIVSIPASYCYNSYARMAGAYIRHLERYPYLRAAFERFFDIQLVTPNASFKAIEVHNFLSKKAETYHQYWQVSLKTGIDAIISIDDLRLLQLALGIRISKPLPPQSTLMNTISLKKVLEMLKWYDPSCQKDPLCVSLPIFGGQKSFLLSPFGNQLISSVLSTKTSQQGILTFHGDTYTWWMNSWSRDHVNHKETSIDACNVYTVLNNPLIKSISPFDHWEKFLGFIVCTQVVEAHCVPHSLWASRVPGTDKLARAISAHHRSKSTSLSESFNIKAMPPHTNRFFPMAGIGGTGNTRCDVNSLIRNKRRETNALCTEMSSDSDVDDDTFTPT